MVSEKITSEVRKNKHKIVDIRKMQLVARKWNEEKRDEFKAKIYEQGIRGEGVAGIGKCI